VIPRKRLVLLVPVCAALVTALWPAEAAAQRRGYRGPVRSVFVGARFGYPVYPYPYYYDPFWWDSYAFQYRPYPPYLPYRYDSSAELRTQVTPKNAEVYIDGYLVGTVDDFDGVLQRLRVPLGEHEITIYEEGYQPFREKMLFRPFETYHIKQSLKPLAAGDSPEPRPAPTPGSRPSGPVARRGMQPPSDPNAPEEQPPAPRGRQLPNDRSADRFGAISVRVQPADAEVLIDGEKWDAPSGEPRLLVQVSEGTHRVEIRKSGYRTYTSTLRVRAGETVPVNVSLAQ
jgi:hypothetical protein